MEKLKKGEEQQQLLLLTIFTESNMVLIQSILNQMRIEFQSISNQ
jgi:hypothetical protein